MSSVLRIKWLSFNQSRTASSCYSSNLCRAGVKVFSSFRIDEVESQGGLPILCCTSAIVYRQQFPLALFFAASSLVVSSRALLPSALSYFERVILDLRSRLRSIVIDLFVSISARNPILKSIGFVGVFQRLEAHGRSGIVDSCKLGWPLNISA